MSQSVLWKVTLKPYKTDFEKNRLTLQKIAIYKVYEAFFVYSLFGTLSGFL